MIIATIEKRINMAMPVPIKRYLSESIYSAKDPGGLLDPLLNRCFMRVLLLRSLLDYFIGSMSISEAKNQDVVN